MLHLRDEYAGKTKNSEELHLVSNAGKVLQGSSGPKDPLSLIMSRNTYMNKQVLRRSCLQFRKSHVMDVRYRTTVGGASRDGWCSLLPTV